MEKEKREVPLRTAYSQAGRCGMQPKAKHSLRAQAQLSETKTETMRTETVETFELVKVEQKTFQERRKEKHRATNSASICVLTIIEDVSGEAQGSVPILLSLFHALDQELLSGVPFPLTAGPLWSSLEHTYATAVRRRHSENCFATVPLSAPWFHFSAR
ncbi:hypothetical protein TNCV_2775941 [Trichonephila clavipes]|nr:hypothetical protein TNCV_2775941 [Trichonephila clavipes]